MGKWTCNICGYENIGQVCQTCGCSKKGSWYAGKGQLVMFFIIYISLDLLFCGGVAISAWVFDKLDIVLGVVGLFGFVIGLLLLVWCINYIKSRKKDRMAEQVYRNMQQEIKSDIKKVEMVCDCGKCYPDGATFCAIDGNPLKRRVIDNYILTCPTCKKIFQEGTKFCPTCGRKIIKTPKI